jgi:hypothetical protein
MRTFIFTYCKVDGTLADERLKFERMSEANAWAASLIRMARGVFTSITVEAAS